MTKFELTREPISDRQLQGFEAGGYVTFLGKVASEPRLKPANSGEKVVAMRYESYDALALSEGATILEQAVTRFGLIDAYCAHRCGEVAVGETAVIVAVSALHRGEAFAGCQWIIDEIKARVPLWKEEVLGLPGPEPVPEAQERDFSRQVALKGWGLESQRKLAAARVLVLGAGGLGNPVLQYLAAAGIGTLGLCDFDTVSAPDLHRQILFRSCDIGEKKVTVAAKRIHAYAPSCTVHVYDHMANQRWLQQVLPEYDLVVEATDTFFGKFLANDECVRAGIPLVSASASGFDGQLRSWKPGFACLRCLYPEGLPEGCVENCASGGVFGPAVGVVGTMLAAEAAQLLIGEQGRLLGHLQMLNVRDWQFKQIRLRKNMDCPVCSSQVNDMKSKEKTINEIDSPETYHWIDIRELPELKELPQVEGFDWIHLPMSSLMLHQVPTGKPLMITCRSGVRSLKVTDYLRQNGFEECYSLAGGMVAMTAHHGKKSK